MTFEPRIAMFLCWKWGYGAADTAGIGRMQYPSNVRTIRVPCVGRVDGDLIVRALRKGADGVLVVGWYEGTCDYEKGNIIAKNQVRHVQQILEFMGIGAARVQFHNCSSAEGEKFAEMVKAAVESMRSLGQNPFKAEPAKENDLHE